MTLVRRSALRRFDWALLVSALLLLGIGFLSLYSLGLRDGAGYFKRQAIMALVGLGPSACFFLINPKSWSKAAWPLYAINVAVLTAVLFVGTSQGGSQRWIDLRFMEFQPSEMAKILTVITLASFLAARQNSIDRISTLALSFLHVAIPAVLIAEQPHYGGAAVLIVIWLCVCVAGNVPSKLLLASLVLLVFAVVGGSQVPGFLHGYHLKRLQSMTQEDKQGASYQQDRALVAVGVGGLTGDGLFHGRQTLPEQENDFVFTVLSEELGLAGSCFVLAAFGFFFYRLWLAIKATADPFYRMLSAGVLGMLAFHTLLNIGMVVHLLPVVGLWLPFISAGGTALWLCMVCVALTLRIRMEEAKASY